MYKRRRKNTNFWKISIIIFFAILLLASSQLISSRNKIFDIKLQEIDYIAINDTENNVMKTINNKTKLKDISNILNKVRGKKTTPDNPETNIDFINIFFKNDKKAEIAIMGNILRVNDKYYILNKRNLQKIEKIFDIK